MKLSFFKISYIIIAILPSIISYPSYAKNFLGIPEIIDGDTIKIDNEKIRLRCIDTPESKYKGKSQYCLDNETNCGQLAKDYLISLIGSSLVNCECEDKKDFYNRYLCKCFKEDQHPKYNGNFVYTTTGISINLLLIDQGYAWFYKSGKKCTLEEDVFNEVKKHKIGLFSDEFGGFKEPKLWRKTRRND